MEKERERLRGESEVSGHINSSIVEALPPPTCVIVSLSEVFIFFFIRRPLPRTVSGLPSLSWFRLRLGQ